MPRSFPHPFDGEAEIDELDSDAVIVALPGAEAARLLGADPPALEDSPIVSVHLLFDRPILHHRLAALLESPAHWVFDRGALTGHSPPDGGQYLTVVSSGVPDLLEVRGRGLVDLMADALTDRLGAAELLWSRVSREPRATFAARPGTRRLRWTMRDLEAERCPRRRLGRLRLAGDDGSCGSERRRRRAGAERMTAVEELTRLDPPSRTGARDCSSSSTPAAGGSGSWSRTRP